MNGAAWLQAGVLVALVARRHAAARSVPRAVYGGGAAPGDRVFLPVERLALPARRDRSEREQPGRVRALAARVQRRLGPRPLPAAAPPGALPLNPTDVDGVPPALAFNTAVSFVTNTNWQNYGGESTMSHLTQMAGLTVQNFVSAAVGIAVAVALIRGLTRRRSATIGNFWVDLSRSTTRVLLPLVGRRGAAVREPGCRAVAARARRGATVEGATQAIYRGPVASQEAIKELGTNGGGIVTRTRRTRSRTPPASRTSSRSWRCC